MPNREQKVPLVAYVNAQPKVVGEATVTTDEQGRMAFVGIITDGRIKDLFRDDHVAELVNFSVDLVPAIPKEVKRG